MMTHAQIRELSHAECEAMLSAHHVGRIAFSMDGRVDVEPIHYVYADGWIFGRTSHGSKRRALAHRPWVAFEVDDVRGVYDWQSVVAHGTVYFMDRDGPIEDRERLERAIALLRDIEPDTLAPDDPVPGRTEVFGLYVDELTGRAAGQAHALGIGD